MFEHLLANLPESVLACRALYDAESGGYHLPLRKDNHALHRREVARYRADYPTVLYDCVEAPVADLLYSVVVNTRSRRILETGTSRGFSTSHLCAGAGFVGGDDAVVVTVDMAPAPNPFFAGWRPAAPIRTVHQDSLRVDVRESAGGANFDLMFFDSLHTYGHLSRELAHYLPHLKLGGVFALHDTLVFDDLGLVVLAMMRNRCVEVVSLPTHRNHGNGMRCPGVTLFRKIARIDAGDLLFPNLDDIVEGERQTVVHPALIVERTGSLFTDARYVAGDLHRGGQRSDLSPALLDPKPGNPRLG